MNLPFLSSVAVCIVVSGGLAVSSGCASSPDAEATVTSMDKFGVEMATVKDSIDDALKSLETLAGSQAGDIAGNFDAYQKSLVALDKQAKVVRGRAEEMKAMGDQFFQEWEPENMSPERRTDLTASFTKIKADMAQAKELSTPFLSSLKDIESYLKLDLSPTGISSTGDLVKKAKDNGAQVKSRIDAVLVQVNSVRGMLSTK